MYAIIETSGKQFKISEGDVIRVDVPMEIGKEIKIDRVLVVVDEEKTVVGNPYIENAEFRAEVIDSGKTRKVLIFKQKPRKGYRRLRGHRQFYTSLKIKGLKIGG